MTNQDRQHRIMTAKEVKAMHANLAVINEYLTPAQAAARLDSNLIDIHNSIHSGYDCIPEYAPIWENGLLDCIESTKVPPVLGSRHYDPAKLDAWFFDCYAPSIMCQPRAA